MFWQKRRDRLIGKPSVIESLSSAPDLKSTYDVVIVGAGPHGCALAYYLSAVHGFSNIAVLDRRNISARDDARNTAIIHYSGLTPETAGFYKKSFAAFRDLARVLDFNLLVSPREHLTLVHGEPSFRSAGWKAEVGHHFGFGTELVLLNDLARLCPELYLGTKVRFPVLGALFQPSGSIIRSDALAQGYARQANIAGAEFHHEIDVRRILRKGGRAIGVETDRGTVHSGSVVLACSDSVSDLAGLADIQLPIQPYPHHTCMSEPYKPRLDMAVVSDTLNTSIFQVTGGGFKMTSFPEYQSHRLIRSEFEFKQHLVSQLIAQFPFLERARVSHQWTQVIDLTPDRAPVLGLSRLENLYIDTGWISGACAAAPAAGEFMAQLIATSDVAEEIKPFGLDRFGSHG